MKMEIHKIKLQVSTELCKVSSPKRFTEQDISYIHEVVFFEAWHGYILHYPLLYVWRNISYNM